VAVVRKIPGTLDDWDRLQVQLADVMSRVWRQRNVVTALPPGSDQHRTQEILLKALDDEEKKLRERIAGLSRHLHVELKNR